MTPEPFENDVSLVRGCLGRDLASWSALVKKYSPLVSISIETHLKKYKIYPAAQDVEDIRQEIFADIWENNKLATIVNQRDISYWIAVLSGNAALAHFRSRDSRQSMNNLSLSRMMENKELGDFLCCEKDSPQKEASDSETEGRINDAIGSLPEKERLIVKMHFVHGKKYHEIAVFTGIPKGTVSSYIKRAREKLRKKLKKVATI
jgi:RNA polymerase sigma-70 factor (ECF subfamily)